MVSKIRKNSGSKTTYENSICRYKRTVLGHLRSDILVHPIWMQGSILGPLLFILYVKDLAVCLESSVANMHADDTAFYYSNRSLSEVKDVLQSDMTNVTEWLNCNKLSLNVTKTVSMIICSHQKKMDRGL